jgi:hypothetical protein
VFFIQRIFSEKGSSSGNTPDFYSECAGFETQPGKRSPVVTETFMIFVSQSRLIPEESLESFIIGPLPMRDVTKRRDCVLFWDSRSFPFSCRFLHEYGSGCLEIWCVLKC